MEKGTSQNNSLPFSPWFVLATTMLGTTLIGLDRMVVNIAMPSIISDFGLTVSTAGWIATSYIISNAVFVPVFGKLGDMIGNRVIYIWSFMGFIIVSLLAGLAWNFTSLIIFRAIQGLIGAAIYPTSMSLIAKSFTDHKKRASALGIWSASFAVSAIIGPLIGGYLTDYFSWRSIFYINLPIGIIGLLMAKRFLIHDKPHNVGKFDYFGSLILAIAITSIVLVLDRGQEWGLTSEASITAYVVALVFSIFFYKFEKNHSNPVIDFKFFKNPLLASIFSISFISFGGMMGAMFLIPIFAQQFLGYDAIQTGLIFLPMALTMFIISPIGAKLSATLNPKILITSSVVIASFGLYLFSGLDAATKSTDLILPLVVFSFGMSLSLAPLTSIATTAVPANEIGISSGLLNLVRNIGGAFGIAVLGTILTSNIKSNVLMLSQNTTVNMWSNDLHELIPTLLIEKASIMAYDNVFKIAALIMVFGVIPSLVLKKAKNKKPENSEEPSGFVEM